MRELKFRMWNEDTKKMSLDVHKWSTFNILIMARKILIQYTGLKDKNGVEIYEGDIYSDGFKLRHEYIVWNNRFASFTGRSKAYDNCVNLSEDFAARIEVIGNIYENPELMEKG